MTKKLSFVMSLAVLLGATLGGSALGADPAASLVGYWKLDGDTLDSSGLENHGTTEGDPVFEAGMFEQAMYFDGNGDYLVLDSVADDFTDDDLTLSAWIKTADTGTWQWWFSCNTAGGGNVIILGLISGNIVVHQGAVQVTSTTVVNDLEWRHVAYTRTGNTGNLYINGEFEGTHTTSFTLSADNRWSIAQEWDSGNPGDFLNGTVDDVRIYDRGLTEDELPQIMTTLSPGAARDPSPANEAIDVPRDAVMSWTPGRYAPAVNAHTVYFSENFDDVNDRIGGVIQNANSYTPAERLEFGTVYYWTVDEVNSPPDSTVFPGEIWRFTVEPTGYPIEDVTVTTTSASVEGSGPENTVNGAGLDEEDLHSVAVADMWLSAPGQVQPVQLEYAFDRAYSLHEMWVWNYNMELEPFVNFGVKNVNVEYSENGVDWTVLGDVEIAQANGTPTPANTAVSCDGAVARYVRLTINSNWGTSDQYGLSEVRFLYIPVWAREPEPAADATGVHPQSVMTWRAGRHAAVHDVYVSTDGQALADGTAPVVTVAEPSFDPGALGLGQTYYWAVHEVNDVEAVPVWSGDVWNFSTREYLVVDDFEGYTDYSPNRVFQTWIDGWGFSADDIFPDGFDGNGTGAQVGNIDPPFAEQTVVHGGAQSMPLAYSNTTMSYSETERTFAVPQDWTLYGIQTLTVHFRGNLDNTGQLYVKINGVKVPYDGDATDIAKVFWQTWNIDLASVNTNLTSVRTLAIGVDGAGAAGMLYIDDILLYPTPPQVIEPVEPDNAFLVAHYAFDGDVTDGSGNGYHGQPEGGPVHVAGVKGQALEFDGIDDVVRIADQDGLNPGDGSYSWTFWARLDPTAGTAGSAVWDLAVNKRETGSNGFYIGANRDQGNSDQAGFKLMLGDTGGSRVDTGYGIAPLGEWVFVACVLDRDQNVHKISVDGGNTWMTAAPPAGPIAPVQDLGIGFDIGPNNYWFHGAIDEVRLYNVALTDAEVVWLAGN
jgi:hypothetical protein